MALEFISTALLLICALTSAPTKCGGTCLHILYDRMLTNMKPRPLSAFLLSCVRARRSQVAKAMLYNDLRLVLLEDVGVSIVSPTSIKHSPFKSSIQDFGSSRKTSVFCKI